MADYSLDGIPPEVVRELRAWSEPDFICAMCHETIDCRWNPRGSGRQIPPICNTCERVSGYSWSGSPRYRANLKGGNFMDRRNATRILALADEIVTRAKRIEWSNRHGA